MTGIALFSIGRLPRIVFGAGASAGIAKEARAFGPRALVVTGRRSFRESPRWAEFEDGCRQADLEIETVTVEDEPSPDLVDATVARFRQSARCRQGHCRPADPGQFGDGPPGRGRARRSL